MERANGLCWLTRPARGVPLGADGVGPHLPHKEISGPLESRAEVKQNEAGRDYSGPSEAGGESWHL